MADDLAVGGEYRPTEDAEAPEGTTEVTEVVSEEPTEQVTDDAEEYELPSAWQEDENFRSYQSKRDKREAELRKQNKTLESRLTALESEVQTSQSKFQEQANLRNQRQGLIDQLESIDAAMEGMPENSTAGNALRQQGAVIASQLAFIDIQTEATRYGVDPEHQMFTDALQSGMIQDIRDIQIIAMELALENGTTPAKPPPTRGKAKNEVDPAELRKQIEADVLQQHGLTKVPSTKPKGTAGALEKAKREYAELKYNPQGFVRRLELLNQFPELKGT